MIERLPELVNADPGIVRWGREMNETFMLEVGDVQYLVSVRAGRIREALIRPQRRDARLSPALIRQFQKFTLGGQVFRGGGQGRREQFGGGLRLCRARGAAARGLRRSLCSRISRQREHDDEYQEHFCAANLVAEKRQSSAFHLRP